LWDIVSDMETLQTPLPLAFCEPVWASSSSYWHLRLLDPGEEMRFGGGLTKPALCGGEVAWDVDSTVTRASLDDAHICPKCREAAKTI
jgi:hypothetical protein